MKLIKLKCSNCGANLETEEKNKKIKCQYCNATTIIDDEVIKIEHKIINDVLDRKQRNAAAFLYKLKKYNEAKKLYLELSEETPEDPTVYKGIILSETENFTRTFNTKENTNVLDLELLSSSYKTYKLLENNEEFKNKYEDYFEKYTLAMQQKQNKDKDDRNFGYILTIVIIICIALIITFAQFLFN